MKIPVSIYEFINEGFITKDLEDSFLEFINEAVDKKPPTNNKIINAINNRNFVGM